MKVNLDKIVKVGWLQRWSGSYTFISCSYWGPQYHTSLKRILKIGFNHILFIHHKGTASFYVSEKEFRSLGRYLANKSTKNNNFAKNFCQSLKRNTDILLSLMEKLGDKIPSLSEYNKFLTAFDNHLAFHVFVKKTIDFLPPETLKKLLPYFKGARLYSERVYSQSEIFFRNVMKTVAKKEKYNHHYLTCLTQKEFEEYIAKQVLPNPAILKRRFAASALYFKNNKVQLVLGEDVKKLEKLMRREQLKNKGELKGVSAFPGDITGVARVVPDPFKVKIFNQGDILVTGMTRPEFLPIIHKASAIVTESGGILSHAAITAREFRKPCIVGTQIATKIIKDGQKIKVNATNGIITII